MTGRAECLAYKSISTGTPLHAAIPLAPLARIFTNLKAALELDSAWSFSLPDHWADDFSAIRQANTKYKRTKNESKDIPSPALREHISTREL